MITAIEDFVGEINIPNPTQSTERITYFINKYEPLCLQSLFGYPLYKSFLFDATTQRFQDILFGKEYTNLRGNLVKWNGLIYSWGGATLNSTLIGLSQFPNEQIQADVTTGFMSGINTFTFDGTSGKRDWRGRSIRLERAEFGVMFQGFDYSWDTVLGTVTLLKAGDIFPSGQWLDAIFNPVRITENAVVSPDKIVNVIAEFIYWYYMKDNTIWNSGVGTKIAKGSNTLDISPALKMNRAWNEFSNASKDFIAFVLSFPDTYPEFNTDIAVSVCNWAATVNDFDF